MNSSLSRPTAWVGRGTVSMRAQSAERRAQSTVSQSVSQRSNRFRVCSRRCRLEIHISLPARPARFSYCGEYRKNYAPQGRRTTKTIRWMTESPLLCYGALKAQRRECSTPISDHKIKSQTAAGVSALSKELHTLRRRLVWCNTGWVLMYY